MDDDWIAEYILTPSVTLPGERAALYRAAARGDLTRVTRGVYVTTAYWASLDFEGRHRARMRGCWLIDPTLVFSHLSAALMWGLPVVGGDLAVPHALGDPAGGGRSRTGLRRHSLSGHREVEMVAGLPVTSLAQTCVDVAAGYEPEVSIPILDAALAGSGVERDGILDALAAIPRSGGAVRGAWAARFADARSGSPGESLSRVTIHRLRLPAPDLQVSVRDASGLAGIVDFFWEDHRLVGEFDGIGKYLREEFTSGREPGEVVVAEKQREDRIRATHVRVARWGWDAARDPAKLGRILSSAGLRPR